MAHKETGVVAAMGAEVLEAGGTIEGLFEASRAIQRECADYIVRNATLRNVEMAHPCDLSYRPEGGARRTAPMGAHAFGQLCARIGVPAQYMRKCLQEGEHSCAVENMNTWLARHKKDLLVRECAGAVRGVLSSRYSPLDAPDVLDAVFDEGLPFGGFELRGSHVSPERLHFRLTEPRGMFEKDDLFAGISVDSSDVGRSQLLVQFFVFKLVCTNGMTSVADGGVLYGQRHVGVTKDDFRRGLAAALGRFEEYRESAIERIARAKARPVFDEGDSEEGKLRGIGAAANVGESRARAMLGVMEARGYGASLWGVANAMTELAQGRSLEGRLELERDAGLLVAA